MAYAGPGPVGCDDDNLAAVPDALIEHLKPCGIDTVIVCQNDFQIFFPDESTLKTSLSSTMNWFSKVAEGRWIEGPVDSY